VCDFVYNVIDCFKLIVLVMMGYVIGVGFVVGFFVDVLIVIFNVWIVDGYMKFGVVVGDYVVIVWLLFCGMVKVKYYLYGGVCVRVGLFGIDWCDFCVLIDRYRECIDVVICL